MKKVERTFIVFILALVVILILVLWIFLHDASAGGIHVKYEQGNERTSDFAEKLILELQKRVDLIYEFAGDYTVNIYLGAFPYPETGETKSIIGIFVDGENKSVFRVWHDDLFSERAMRRKVEEAVERIFERIRKLDTKKRKKIMEIPV